MTRGLVAGGLNFGVFVKPLCCSLMCEIYEAVPPQNDLQLHRLLKVMYSVRLWLWEFRALCRRSVPRDAKQRAASDFGMQPEPPEDRLLSRLTGNPKLTCKYGRRSFKLALLLAAVKLFVRNVTSSRRGK